MDGFRSSTGPLPLGLETRAVGQTVELSLRPKLAVWYRQTLWLLPVVLVVGTIALRTVGEAHAASGRVWNWPYLAAEVPLAIGTGGGLLLGLIALAAGVVGGTRVVVDRKKGELRIQDGYIQVLIPLRDVRGVGVTVHRHRRLDLDPGGSPWRVVSLRRPVTMDLDVPGGRLRFCRTRTPWEVPHLAAAVADALCRRAPRIELVTGDEGLAVDADVYKAKHVDRLRFASVIPPMVMVIVCFAVLLLAVQSWHWPTVAGRVTRSHWEAIQPAAASREEEVQFEAEIAYTYSVGGETHDGTRVGFGRVAGDDVVRDLIRAHPVGSAVTVYYDPLNPDLAALIQGPAPVEWVTPVFVPLLLGFTLLAFRLRRPTPEQEELAYRYRVQPTHPGRQLSAEDVAGEELPTWKTPLAAVEKERRRRRRTYLMAAGRTFVMCLLVWYGCYAYFSPRLPGFFADPVAKYVFAGATAFCTLFVAAGVFASVSAATFRLTPEGIHISSLEFPLVRYAAVRSYTVTRDPWPPHAATLVLHRRDGNARHIPLTAEVEARVLEAVAQHLPKGEPPPQNAPVRKRDWVVGMAITTAFVVVAGRVIGDHYAYLHARDQIPTLQLLLVVLGPGTLVAAFLFRRRAKVQLFALAFALNMLGMLGSLLLAILPRLTG